MKLLATNYKLDKEVPGWKITGLSLAPHTVAGGPTVCPYSTAECRSVCLGTETGLNVLQSAIKAKIAKTRFWQSDPEGFKEQLYNEIRRADRSARALKLKLAVRLNVYSDIRWENEFPELFELLPQVQFYDYTKWPARTELPSNYHLTYSYSGTNASKNTAREYLCSGVNVAVVYPEAPPKFDEPPFGLGFLKVINGDLNDFRPADPKRCIVGLKFKGAKSGLVQLKKFVQPQKAA